MEYQAKEKNLLCTILTTLGAEQVRALESLNLFGNATRVDSKFFPSADNLRAKVSVYRPEELTADTPVRIRILARTHRGSIHYKIIFIPLSEDGFKQESEEYPEDVMPLEYAIESLQYYQVFI